MYALVPAPGYGVAAPSGVTVNSGVNLNSGMIAFLNRLRASTSVPIHVTSGVRSTSAQASALVGKRTQAGDAATRALYSQKDLIEEIIAVANTTPAMTVVLDKQVARGRFLSRHMRGDALDLRTRNLTSTQALQLKAAAQRLGAHAIIETAPAHLHIGKIGAGSAITDTVQIASKAVKQPNFWAIFGAMGAAVVLLSILTRRPRAPRYSDYEDY